MNVERQRSSADDNSAQTDQTCGVVMPIADYDGRSAEHWIQVQDLINRSIRKAGFEPKPVWIEPGTDVIHERILVNLFTMPIIVADVSGLNPNVMFEIGMRMTTALPIVLVADDSTELPFDTKLIDHEFYPRSLPFHAMERFIDRVADRVRTIYNAQLSGRYKPFIKRFDPVFVTPASEEIGTDALIAIRLERIESTLSSLSDGSVRPRAASSAYNQDPWLINTLGRYPDLTLQVAPPLANEITRLVGQLPLVEKFLYDERRYNFYILLDSTLAPEARKQVGEEVTSIVLLAHQKGLKELEDERARRGD